MQTQAHPDKSHFSVPKWKPHTKHKHCPLSHLEMAKFPVELLPGLWRDHTGGSHRTWMHFKTCSPGICKEQAGSSNFPFLVFPNFPAQGGDAEGDSCACQLTYSHVKLPCQQGKERQMETSPHTPTKTSQFPGSGCNFPKFCLKLNLLSLCFSP